MANRTRGYGLTAELTDKIRAQYSEKDEQEITQWFSSLGLAQFNGQGYDDFQEYLKDGMILCNLALKLEPGAIRKINDVPSVKNPVFKASKSNENIGNFLAWAKRYGVPDSNTFQTADLFEGNNLSSVQRMIFNLGGVAQKKGFQGPAIGVKVSDENKRNFTEQQLKAGQNVISKQMGNNQGASQAGMTGYGTGRQIIDRTSERSSGVDYSTSSLQYGSNQGASQAGMTGYGATRQIIDKTSEEKRK